MGFRTLRGRSRPAGLPWRWCVVLAIAAGSGAGPFTAPGMAAQRRGVGPVKVFVHVPYPGNPGGLAVDRRTLWVDTSAANFDRPFDGSSSVFAYDLRTRRLKRRRPNPIVVPKPPVAAMGLAGIALDAAGRHYIADMNGQVVRVDPRVGRSDVYARVPTSTSTSFTDMPSFDAFGRDGSLYVGEAGGQPLIWRVPPGGGKAQLWFADPRLAGSYGASVVGLAVDPSGRRVYFAVGNQKPQITIYSLPLKKPTAANLRVVHTYSDLVTPSCSTDPHAATDPNTPGVVVNCAATAFFGAGGIAFGRSGRLYVALFSKNQISILGRDGKERVRFPRPSANMRLKVPVNGPFGLAFDGRGSLLIANVGDPSLSYGPGHVPPPGGLPDSSSWAVLSARVDDRAARLFRPRFPRSQLGRVPAR